MHSEKLFKKGWKKRLLKPSLCLIWKAARGWLPHNASFTLRIIWRRRKTKNFQKKNLTVAVVFPFVFRYLKAISTGPPSTAIVLIKLSSSCDF